MADLKGYSQLQARLHAISGAGGDGVLKMLALRVVREQKLLTVPFRKTGNLGASIQVQSVSPTRAIVAANANYAGWVEHGTGIYGPRKQKITPKAAKVLAWRVGAVRLTGSSRTKGGKELAGWAFARSVRGRPATPFFFPGAKKAVAQSGLKDVVISAWNGAA